MKEKGKKKIYKRNDESESISINIYHYLSKKPTDITLLQSIY